MSNHGSVPGRDSYQAGTSANQTAESADGSWHVGRACAIGAQSVDSSRTVGNLNRPGCLVGRCAYQLGVSRGAAWRGASPWWSSERSEDQRLDEVTIELRDDADPGAVRSSLDAFCDAEGASIRLDRPLREIAGGRHFHLAAPSRGTGTLEVNVEPGGPDGGGQIRIVLRPTWTGTWAGGAYLTLAEHLATDLGKQ